MRSKRYCAGHILNRLVVQSIGRIIFLGLLIVMMALGYACSETPTKPASSADRSTPPPAQSSTPDYVISNMETTGRVDGDLARFETTLAFSVLSEGWHYLKLFPSEVSLTGFKVQRGKKKKVVLQRQKDAYGLLVGAKGDYQVKLEHLIRIHRERLGRAVNLYFITPVSNSSIRFVIPVKDAKVSVQPEINFGVFKGKGNITEVLLFNTTAEKVVLSWSTEEIAKIVAATYFTEQKTIYTISKGSLRIETYLDYSVLQGELDRFEIALNPDLALVDVLGENVRKWNVREEKDTKILVIETRSSVSKSFRLNLILEKALDTIPISLAAPRIQPLGAEREKGYLAVISKKGIRVEPSNLENISQVDIQDLPLDKKIRGIGLAFKYVKRPFRLVLNVAEIQPKVFGNVTTLAKVSKDSIRLETSIAYTIREAGVFHFKIKLAEGLRIINIEGSNINNWQIKDNVLTVDLRSKAEGSYRFYLSTEIAVKDTKNVPFPVVQLLEVEREQGHIGISAITGIKTEVVSLEGINQINIKEFPYAWLNIPWSKIGEREGKRPPKSCVPVPVLDLAFRYLKHPYTLTLNISDIKPEVSAVVQTTITLDERKLGLSSLITYDIRKAGVFSLKLSFPKELHIIDLKGAQIDDWKRDEAKETLTITLATRIQGRYTLHLKAETPLEKLEDELAIPALRLLDIKKEQGYLAIKADPALRVKADPKNFSRLTEIDLKDLPPEMRRPDLTLAYKYFEQPWQLALKVEKVKPTVMAETFHLVSIGEAIVHTSATIDYQIQNAGIAQFKLLLPEDVINVDIKGGNIKHKGEEKVDDDILWTISLHAPVLNAYKLYVSFQKEMKKDSAGRFEPLRYYGVKVLEVERETGYLAFAARPDMELSPPEPENLTPIDEREIPPIYKTGIDHPILMAFRYLKHPYQLKTTISQHEFSEVLVAVTDACRLSTTISENGQLITDIVCQIRNTREQYLRLYLPEDVEIWHVRVNGQSITCFQGEEQGVPVTLIPIAQQSRSDQAFEVNIRYAWKLKLLGQSGIINLSCPQMNIPMMRLGWSLCLPEKYKIIMDAGNMERVEGFEPLIKRLNPERPSKRVTPVPPVQTRQKQDFQWAMNEAALENVRLIPQRGAGAETRPGRVSGLPSIYTGSKPSTTNTYYYQSLISLNVPGTIYAHYVGTRFGNILSGILGLVVIGLSLFFWFKSRFDPLKKLALMVAVILVIIGIHTLLGEAYKDFFGIIIWTVAIIVILIAGITGAKEYVYPLVLAKLVRPAAEKEPVRAVPEPAPKDQPPEPGKDVPPTESPK